MSRSEIYSITWAAKATNIPLYTMHQSEHGETVFCVDLAANRFFFDSFCSKSGFDTERKFSSFAIIAIPFANNPQAIVLREFHP
jgi:hypothetical protein